MTSFQGFRKVIVIQLEVNVLVKMVCKRIKLCRVPRPTTLTQVCGFPFYRLVFTIDGVVVGVIVGVVRDLMT